MVLLINYPILVPKMQQTENFDFIVTYVADISGVRASQKRGKKYVDPQAGPAGFSNLRTRLPNFRQLLRVQEAAIVCLVYARQTQGHM